MVGFVAPKASNRLNTPTVIVVPCYNEALRLPKQSFVDFVTKHHDIGFLFVDDGSDDGTRGLLESLCELAPTSFSVLPLSRNGGKGEAVRQGLLKALSFGPAFTGYWDADLATPLEELPEFVAIGNRRADVFLVMGSRIQRLGSHIDRSLWRHCVGRIFASLASSILRLSVYDTQCGAKLMRADSNLSNALVTPFRGRWTFDVELILRIIQDRKQGYVARDVETTHSGIIEVPLARWTDVSGSKVRLSEGLAAFFQLAAIWIKTRTGQS